MSAPCPNYTREKHERQKRMGESSQSQNPKLIWLITSETRIGSGSRIGIKRGVVLCSLFLSVLTIVSRQTRTEPISLTDNDHDDDEPHLFFLLCFFLPQQKIKFYMVYLAWNIIMLLFDSDSTAQPQLQPPHHLLFPCLWLLEKMFPIDLLLVDKMLLILKRRWWSQSQLTKHLSWAQISSDSDDAFCLFFS